MSRRAALAGLGGAVVVILAWWFLLWSPQRDRIADARDRRRAAEDQAASLRLQLRRLEDLQAREAVVRSRLERLRVAIPDQPNLAQFILEANEAAERSGIEFLSITPTPPAAPAAPAAAQPGAQAGGPPGEIRLSMTITGGYFQVLDFVNRLEDLPRLVVIDSINVSAGDGDRLNVSLQARMFVGVAPAAPGATTTTTTTAPAATTTTVAGVTTTTAPGATTTAPAAPATTGAP